MRVTALAFPKPDARLFFPPRSLMGSCQTPVKKTILAEPSGGGLRCVPSFSALKTMTSPILSPNTIIDLPAARALCASDPGRRSNFKNQSVTTNDMGQLNAHPSNEPATVCPAVSPRRRRACWRPALNATGNLENQASSGRSSPFPSCRRSGRINNDCAHDAGPLELCLQQRDRAKLGVALEDHPDSRRLSFPDDQLPFPDVVCESAWNKDPVFGVTSEGILDETACVKTFATALESSRLDIAPSGRLRLSLSGRPELRPRTHLDN